LTSRRACFAHDIGIDDPDRYPFPCGYLGEDVSIGDTVCSPADSSIVVQCQDGALQDGASGENLGALSVAQACGTGQACTESGSTASCD
jgi:hypothetical protein